MIIVSETLRPEPEPEAAEAESEGEDDLEDMKTRLEALRS